MSIGTAEMAILACSRRGRCTGGPADRPAQPTPRIRSSRGPATHGSLGGPSCTVARPGSRFVQRLKSVAFAALVVLSFTVAASGIASLSQPDPTPTPTAGDPARTHVTGH